MDTNLKENVNTMAGIQCTSDNKHDGIFFKAAAQRQQDKLMRLAQLADDYLALENTITDNIKGEMRAAAGQARLIVTKKFPQFLDLCERNLNPKQNELPVKPADLEGFWDLMMIEVRSINQKFQTAAANANTNLPAQVN